MEYPPSRSSSSQCSEVILLSVHEDLDFLEAALRAGAGWLCLQASAAHDSVPAIHEIMKGQIFLSRSLH